MREGAAFRIRKDGTTNCDATFDWNAGGDEILKAVDEALKAQGLEIVTHDTFSGFYAFSIKKVQRGKKVDNRCRTLHNTYIATRSPKWHR